MMDWFTVTAQIVNFLVLVALLRYFLYGRIIDAIERRQARLDQQREEARRLRALAQEELEGARRQHQQLAAQKEELLAQVKREVEQYRQSRLEQVREEIDELRRRWAQTLAEEKEAFLREMRREIAEAVLAIVRRVLADLADELLERVVIGKCLARLAEEDAAMRTAPADVSADGGRSVRIRTSSPVDDDVRRRVEAAASTLLGEGVEIEWEVAPDLLCGIALHSDDQKIAWNFRDELDAIEQEVMQTIEEEIQSHQTPPPASTLPVSQEAKR